MLEKGGVAMMGAVEEEDETRGMASCVCLGLSCCVRGICRKVVDRRGSWRVVVNLVKILSGRKIVQNLPGRGRFLNLIFFTVPG